MDTIDTNRDQKLEQALVAQLSGRALAKWTPENALRFQELMSYCRCVLKELEARLWTVGEDDLLRRGSNPVEAVASELKTPERIAEAVKEGGFALTAESLEQNLPDLAEVQVRCAFPSDVYRVADALLKQEGIRLLQKEDFISERASEGYRGLRLLVTVPVVLRGRRREVRASVVLRTAAMELWCGAELRFRERGDGFLQEQVGEELRECAKLIAEWDQRMEQVRYNIKHRVITK